MIFYLSQTTESLGRNGMMKTTGIQLLRTHFFNDGKTIRIYPITSKNRSGRCFIEIPTEDIPKLIEGLKTEMESH